MMKNMTSREFLYIFRTGDQIIYPTRPTYGTDVQDSLEKHEKRGRKKQLRCKINTDRQ